MRPGTTRTPTDSLILIVEDNRVNQLLLTKKLATAGFSSILLAENGQQATDMALKNNPDLVLMDIQLPDMNGNSVIQNLRARKFAGRIVAVSADASPADRARSLAAGADGTISKPIDFNTFFVTIGGFLAPPEAGEKAAKAGPAEKIVPPAPALPGKINPEISAAARNIFIEDGREKLLLLAEALAHPGDEGHMARIKAIAHEYKGNAGYFGLNELERIARELDAGFADQAPDQRLVGLTRELIAVVEGIIHESA